jgi:uncharacterized protein YbjT (DUF2867 family)
MGKDRGPILVVGATGRQGGAVARHLVLNGWEVRAMTRDKTKAIAKGLKDLGAEIVEADLEDKKSLEVALKDAYGVFGVFTPFEKGIEAEVRQGRNLVDAAKEAGISHFVYSSVGGVERNTGIPHFESKWNIENYLVASGLPSTIFRPVFLMENFLNPMNQAAILSGRLESTLGPSTPLQMLAVDDIGGFAAMAFGDPGTWKARALEIAGDQKTMPEVAEAFSRTMGRPVRYVRTRLEAIRNFDARAMLEWFEKEGYRADILRLKKIRPELLTLEEWLKKSKWTGQIATGNSSEALASIGTPSKTRSV